MEEKAKGMDVDDVPPVGSQTATKLFPGPDTQLATSQEVSKVGSTSSPEGGTLQEDPKRIAGASKAIEASATPTKTRRAKRKRNKGKSSKS